tara:strand:- start:98 stop:400 length:303 start_codon:yes stop_codon:yes gene_type:complete
MSRACVEELGRLNPEALLLEPRDIYDSCVIAITNRPADDWPRQTPAWVAVYDFDRCVDALASSSPGCSHESAAEWLYYNAVGAWLGDGTPAFHWVDEWEE